MYQFWFLRDILEIIFFSYSFYFISRWLAVDKDKNLLGHFFLYCALLITSYLLQIPTLHYTLQVYSPVIIMIFILLHEKTLQRNFITLKNVTPAQKINNSWLEMLFRGCLGQINKNKEVNCIIENTDNLTSLLTTPFVLDTDLDQSILNLFFESPSFNQEQMIWVTTKSKIKGINATWLPQDITKSIQATKLPKFQEALAHTKKTDALFFHIDPLTHSFTVITNGKEFSNVAAHHARQLILKYIKKTSLKKGEQYEMAQAEKNSLQQRAP